jgi:hypothetical protein
LLVFLASEAAAARPFCAAGQTSGFITAKDAMRCSWRNRCASSSECCQDIPDEWPRGAHVAAAAVRRAAGGRRIAAIGSPGRTIATGVMHTLGKLVLALLLMALTVAIDVVGFAAAVRRFCRNANPQPSSVTRSVG